MADPGGIRNEDAYARGKMLDHSSWQKGERLPRLITPSDIDMVFDNGGWILLCEISSAHSEWGSLDKGQVLTYENLVFQTTNCAVLCKHSVPLIPKRAIDTKTDINSFQVMLYGPAPGIVRSRVFAGNKNWQRFVFAWFDNPKKAHADCLEHAVRTRAA